MKKQEQSSNRSVRLQVDTNYTSTLQLQGITGSGVGVESPIDYITRIYAISSDMKDGLQGLYSLLW